VSLLHPVITITSGILVIVLRVQVFVEDVLNKVTRSKGELQAGHKAARG
jgi:hypothetical protein